MVLFIRGLMESLRICRRGLIDFNRLYESRRHAISELFAHATARVSVEHDAAPLANVRALLVSVKE